MDFSNMPTEVIATMVRALQEELSRRKKISNATRRAEFLASLKPVEPFPENAEIELSNGKRLLSVPFFSGTRNHVLVGKCRYLPALDAQDWSHLFQDYEDESSEFYVYAHVNPSDFCVVTTADLGGNFGGMPFYVGKGSGLRAYDLKRNQGHGIAIKSVLDRCFQKDDIVKIVRSGLSERKAMEFEAKLIYFFGTQYEKPPGILLNLDISKRPAFVGTMERLKSRQWSGKEIA